MTDKDVFGLEDVQDLNDLPAKESIRGKTKKNLPIVISVILICVVTPIVWYQADRQESKQSEKKAETKKQQAASSIQPHQSLSPVTSIVEQQKETAQKDIDKKQAEVVAQQGQLQNGAQSAQGQVVNNLPKPPSPLGNGQFQSLAVPQNNPSNYEALRTAAAQKVNEIAGSQLIALKRQGSIADKLVGSQGGAQRLENQGYPALQALNQATRADDGSEKIADAMLKASQPLMPLTNAERDKKWLKDNSSEIAKTDAIRPSAPSSRFTVFEGTIIPAVMLTEVNSDLPGRLIAQVTLDVYDGIGGTTLLIPKGTRLVGLYNNDVKIGQERVLAAFNRMIYPSGVSVALGGMQAADAAGRAGLSGEVDNHFFTMFGSSFLVAGLANIFSKNQPQSVTVINSGSSVTSTAGQILADVSKKIMQRNQNIAPTLLIHKGHKFNIMVAKDMELRPSSTMASATE